MIGDKESGGKIKTFLAKKRPEEFKVFQFTKEMLPELKVSFNKQGYYMKTFKINETIMNITYWGNGAYELSLGQKQCTDIFDFGDYIGEQGGNYFVIKKEVFEKDWREGNKKQRKEYKICAYFGKNLMESRETNYQEDINKIIGLIKEYFERETIKTDRMTFKVFERYVEDWVVVK